MLEWLLPVIFVAMVIAVLSSSVGVFVVWRRMAYFGDTLAHASLLGVTIALIIELPIYFTLITFSILLAVALALLQRKNEISIDTLMGVISHSALSLSLVIISFFDNIRVDLISYLFGDILSSTYDDLLLIGVVGIILLLILYFFWNALLSFTIQEIIAKAEGIQTDYLRILLMVLISIVIAISMKLIGILVITSMLIIPSAAARFIAKTPFQMLVIAIGINLMSAMGGIGLSVIYDTPTGPSMVMVSTILFFLFFLWHSLKSKR